MPIFLKTPLYFPCTLLASIISINDTWGNLNRANLPLVIGGRGEGLMSFYLHVFLLGVKKIVHLVESEALHELVNCNGDLQELLHDFAAKIWPAHPPLV